MNGKEAGQDELKITSVEEAIKKVREEHKAMGKAIEGLSNEELAQTPIFEDSGWTIKDIITHISAWHRQLVEDIDLVINDKKPWYIGEDEEKAEDKFNKQEVKKRKDWPLEKVVQDWEASHLAVIRRAELLTNEEWTHRTNYTWEDGTPLTVHSLFDYNYEGANHEGGHAKQIIEWRKLKLHPQSQ